MNFHITMNTLSLKDLIELIGIVVGIGVSVSAVYVARKSNKIAKEALLANNRMIEESTRPYITIYPYIYNPGTMLYGLIIKNSGPTGCVIDSFECDYKYFSDSINGLNNVSIEQTLISLTLGPSQSKIIHLDRHDIPESPIAFRFSYSTTSRTYSDTASIDFNAGVAIPLTSGSTEGKELQRIYEVLLEILRKDI
ncbi:hypothetical protein [Erysipelothrix anatis]|uniref:hypothetical protein n=1 Tax=Erysipelothrix anatis TaxID=2683713 RepID=UPI0013579034|nr:hypothetical protein [Erysipelothrix anatis]